MGFHITADSTPTSRHQSAGSMATVLRRRLIEIPPPLDMADLGSPRFPHVCMTFVDRTRTVAAEYKAVSSAARHADARSDGWHQRGFGPSAAP
ncbi:hypothetical protein SPRG_18843 [Saprolegnia parasitica CBS 223.65]|uniref:Uncharacterized protein n=1 Tax=Saprolegnia parasitica (strain CBS 223.65) TaxID=695850 RepID=A0A067CYE4_SAPPC|nr:hypothetical protein SPRG_18843 [Saprolegnia parasitica CBS 223.65]KDO35684.1 hypothetical protein SPRG_18843 [Saprolegnia parasitica CBS 223.65]|eukprot:XP_012194059.1 hypothetical protein SPRG_18843 [Saprolegnia parasitica CBS 223.65]